MGTSMSSTTDDKSSWHCLPSSIRNRILGFLLQDSCSLASFATVSREWQTIIEKHNFARITLTLPRLNEFSSIIRRNRTLVRYIWLCLELEEYDCSECTPEVLGFSNTDNTRITTAFQNLFSTLSTWEPNGSLLLDISVHSPSDSEHWFKYLTFKPDVPSDEHDSGESAEQSILAKLDDDHHGWVAGRRDILPTSDAVHKVFDEIMDVGPFDTDEQEYQWWQQLPLVPAVTSVLLRLQTRRRWRPTKLAQMLARLPRLEELHYEPWKEWFDGQQTRTDQFSVSLLRSLASSQLQRLVLFENSDKDLERCFPYESFFREPPATLSRAVAYASLKLEHLSASYMVEAGDFFRACQSTWNWPNLTCLGLTSHIFGPIESRISIDNMLQAAAAAVTNMPKLEIMEIWNEREGFAMLFRYQPAKDGQSAVITWKGSREFVLRPPVIQAWEDVAMRQHGQETLIVGELIDADADITSHGDAIDLLKLSIPPLRPVSLRQIQMEHRVRGSTHMIWDELLSCTDPGDYYLED